MNTYLAPGLIHLIKQSRENEMTRSLAHEQLRSRPEIDDVVCHYLDGSTLKDALYIIDNIREHKMKIKWSSINVWSIWYRRKHVCDLSIKNDALHIGKVNGILEIRVTDMLYSPESVRRLILSLRDSIASRQESDLALPCGSNS